MYMRSYKGQKLLVICNFTEKEIVYDIPRDFKSSEVLISNYGRNVLEESVTLAAYECAAVLGTE